MKCFSELVDMNAIATRLSKACGLKPTVVDGNFIFNYENIDLSSTKIKFSGRNNILFVSGEIKVANTVFDFRSDDSVAFICSTRLRANILLGHGCVVYIGKDTTFTNTCNITAAESCDVFLGEECMIAEHVYITNTDGHPIYDQGGRRINFGGSIYIGDHVWIGRNSEILKGVKIHSGSVVGANSVVTKDVPSNSICVGVPARVVRRNISFGRNTTLRAPPNLSESVAAPVLFEDGSLGNAGRVIGLIREWATAVQLGA